MARQGEAIPDTGEGAAVFSRLGTSAAVDKDVLEQVERFVCAIYCTASRHTQTSTSFTA